MKQEKEKFGYYVNVVNNGQEYSTTDSGYDTFEEAESALIDEVARQRAWGRTVTGSGVTGPGLS